MALNSNGAKILWCFYWSVFACIKYAEIPSMIQTYCFHWMHWPDGAGCQVIKLQFVLTFFHTFIFLALKWISLSVLLWPVEQILSNFFGPWREIIGIVCWIKGFVWVHVFLCVCACFVCLRHLVVNEVAWDWLVQYVWKDKGWIHCVLFIS